MGEKFPVTVYGRKVGMGQMIGEDRVSVELDPAYVSMMRQGMTRGLSADLPDHACLCDYQDIRMGEKIVRTKWTRDPACAFPHIGGTLTGAPSPPVVPALDPVAGRPCGCVPGEECAWCRNRVAFRRELFPPGPPPKPFFRQNWEAIQDELAVDLRGEPVPGFKRAPFPDRPADVEGMEVRAVLCMTDSHAGTVPAVVWGQFRVPWWTEGRAEPAAYCSACSRIMQFIGYFTPDEADR